MRQRLIVLLAVLAVISGWGLPRSQAQGPAPQTYSLTEDPGWGAGEPHVVKLSRDGAKEVVEQIIPPGPGGPAREFRAHTLYDFQAHKMYYKILSDPSVPCSVQHYTDPAAPWEFDVISGSDALMKEITGPKGQTKQVGTETLNGVATKVMEVTSADGKSKVWIAQKGGFPVKIVHTGADGKVVTFLEVKQLSFAKPPASAFTPPQGCAETQNAPASTPTTNVAASTPTTNVAASTLTTNVTAVTIQKVLDYSGPCPAHISLAGTITVDRPGTVFYQFIPENSATEHFISFSAAGTKTVTQIFTFDVDLFSPINRKKAFVASLAAIGVDSAQHHGTPTTPFSNNANFSITCTSRGGGTAELAEDNPTWGYTRILGALKNVVPTPTPLPYLAQSLPSTMSRSVAAASANRRSTAGPESVTESVSRFLLRMMAPAAAPWLVMT